MKELLREKIGRAIWESTTDCTCPWNKLYPNEQEEWRLAADAAIKAVVDAVLIPEYARWSKSQDELSVAAIGALANVIAHLGLGKPAEASELKEVGEAVRA